MMDFELKLTKPNRSGAWIEGLVMGVSYLLGILNQNPNATSSVLLLTR